MKNRFQIGDIVIQTYYDWGKDDTGDFYTYRVESTSQSNDSNYLFGNKISCLNLQTGERPLSIPDRCFIGLQTVRELKISNILDN